jgi:CPA1 family monovalent cation:H+ antiporter
MPLNLIADVFALALLAAALLGIVGHRLHLPYAVLLVVAGLAVGLVPGLPVPRLEPELLLFAFLPPLLFDAAFRLDARWLAKLRRMVLLLAVPGVIVTAIAVAGALWIVLGLPFELGLLFGSLVAATDPVAVTAVFSFLRVGPRLTTLVEGESLINDGTAITLYTGVLGVVVLGRLEPAALATLFVGQVAGGALIGGLLALVASRLTRLVDDHLIEMTLSTALAYGSYLAADALGASGPLACVTAGLIHGTYGRQFGLTETNRRLLDDLWEYLGFLANSIVFVLLGLTVDLTQLLAHGRSALVAIAAVLVARVAIVWGTSRLASSTERLSRPEGVLVIWGGLRGALTVALALGIPSSVANRDQLIAMAFGVVLFSLVVQGLTLAPLIRRLGGLTGERRLSVGPGSS